MGMFDFLKVTVVEKKSVPKYTAHVTIGGKEMPVTNLGMQSVTITGGDKLRTGQDVTFDLALKDPKEKLSLHGVGKVMSVAKGEAKIALSGLPEAQRQSVAKFLARYALAG